MEEQSVVMERLQRGIETEYEELNVSSREYWSAEFWRV